jgi:hypothetical protein
MNVIYLIRSVFGLRCKIIYKIRSTRRIYENDGEILVEMD